MQEISRQWWLGYFASLTAGLALIVLLSWYLFPRPETPTPEPPPKTAADLPALAPEELFTRMRWARENIRAFHLEERWEHLEFDQETPLDVPDPSGTVVSLGTGEWTVKGDYFRVTRHFDIAKTFHPKPIKERELRSGGSVKPDAPVNDKIEAALSNSVMSLEPKKEWVAFDGKQHAWFHGNGNSIYLTPVALMPADPGNDTRGPHPLRWGFAGAETSIPKLFETPGKFDMTVTTIDAESGPRYVLAHSPVPNDHDFRFETEVDPHRDYLIAKRTTWREGRNVETRETSFQQAENGYWYPAKGVERDLEGIRTVEFSNAVFNPILDDRIFYWENMPFDAHTVRLVKRTSDKTFTRMRFRNGRWEAR